ncbi:substrate-binding periplasmic protein [Arsukibacterium sp.]|uniref:substrate-binding periplasmic protein n=1 Tax=Arsukibacterium sp. TaxID=1977258 RepID=UPI00356AAD3A
MPTYRCLYVVLMFCLLCSLPLLAKPKQEVLLLTYHFKAPYIVDANQQQGLYFDLANYLNRYSKQFSFRTEFMPRRRIDAMLQQSFGHVVIGVQPVWFKQLGDKVQFTQGILQENDIFVSLATNPFIKNDLNNVSGKTFIGVQGYRYIGLEQAEKNSSLIRFDTLHEENVLDMLRLGRGDFTVISQSTLHYKIRHGGENPALYYVAEKPHEHIIRRLMYSSNAPHLGAELNSIISQMKNDPAWLAVLEKYNLDPSFIPLA